ncbi:MAG: hypothetical protein E7429_06670 [Ruminococcaceae bacterium]|nr:hypothetical protein [Oscillospiraceae bacterium]
MNCDIIQDLLPLYYDGVCSAGSRKAVEEHLESCEDCRGLLADLDAPLPGAKAVKAADDATAVKKISGEWEKSKWLARVRGAAIATAVCAIVFGLWYGLTQWNIVPVAVERIEVSNVRQLSDGRVLYRLCVGDGYDLSRIRYSYDDEGNMFVEPIRPVLPAKRNEQFPNRWDKEMFHSVAEHNKWEMEYGSGVAVTRIWIGRGPDAVLLWEEGIELPAASAADEEAWGYVTGSAQYWAERTAG